MDLKLAESYAEHLANRKDAEWIGALGKVVRHAFGLFDTGRVTLSLERSSLISGDDAILWIEIERLPGLPFKFKYDERAIGLAYFPEEVLFEQIREPLFNHFRYRPSLPVDDHIVLGED